MAIQTVNIGTTPNDGTGDPARTSFTKINDNFTQPENAASHLLLGTVSQSGGVPTGAIIERGSNANGEYVKYADGTMMCAHIVTLTPGTWVIGPVKFSPLTSGITFPATFIGVPKFIPVLSDNDIASRSAGYAYGTVSVAGVSDIYISSPTTGTPGGSPVSISYVAIGRWY